MPGQVAQKSKEVKQKGKIIQSAHLAFKIQTHSIQPGSWARKPSRLTVFSVRLGSVKNTLQRGQNLNKVKNKQKSSNMLVNIANLDHG